MNLNILVSKVIKIKTFLVIDKNGYNVQSL